MNINIGPLLIDGQMSDTQNKKRMLKCPELKEEFEWKEKRPKKARRRIVNQI